MRGASLKILWLSLLTLHCAHSSNAKPSAGKQAPHPLDPLSAVEIVSAVDIIRSESTVSARAVFPMVALLEPAKHTRGTLHRAAVVVSWDPETGETKEHHTDLVTRQVISTRVIPGVQPGVLIDEFTSITDVIRSDARWQAAMKKRGIEDFHNVQIDVWAPGFMGLEGETAPLDPNVRMLRALSFYRGEASTNPYARPIEGVVALVDVRQQRVVEVVDRAIAPVSRLNADLDAASIGQQREAPKPLHQVQPEGASFKVEGQQITWQKWQFRYVMHPREGLVLYHVGYHDQGQLRPILYRASVSEMFVPYGDPDPIWAWRSAFDQGEYGFGRLANTLDAGSDVPDHATFFDAVFANDQGVPYDQARVVALYERDAGIAWSHTDFDTMQKQTRRARELVIGYVVTIGNYDYGMNWVFGQDGSMHFEAELTGIMLAKGASPSQCEPCRLLRNDVTKPLAPAFGHVVAETIVAPHHQHFFNMRLDFDVDGPDNAVAELNTRAIPMGVDNPHGNAFVIDETLLPDEMHAKRDLHASTNRAWRILNLNSVNKLGHIASYALVPGHNTLPLQDANSTYRRRAPFTKHHVWVTHYNENERYGAGAYPNQSIGGDGLELWASNNEPLVNRDLVLWYTFGATHLPRAEEWPVMPTTRIGFKLIPMGFFSANPALDIPPSGGE